MKLFDSPWSIIETNLNLKRNIKMKKKFVKTPVWISEDGEKFSTYQKCLEHEEKLKYVDSFRFFECYVHLYSTEAVNRYDRLHFAVEDPYFPKQYVLSYLFNNGHAPVLIHEGSPIEGFTEIREETKKDFIANKGSVVGDYTYPAKRILISTSSDVGLIYDEHWMLDLHTGRLRQAKTS